MKKILLFLMVLLASLSAWAQNGIPIDSSNFPDANFRNYLLSRPYGSDGVLTDGEIAAHRYGNNGWACRHSKQEFILTAEQVERATHALGWLDTLPTMPVRIARIGWHRAVPVDFEGVPFETFIVCDNLYQGYLAINTVTGGMGIK